MLGFWRAVRNSVTVAGAAALFTVGTGLALVYARRLTANAFVRAVVPIASLGYALPGTVLALGLLLPLAAFDNAADSLLRSALGISSGLFLSGSLFIIVLAYTVRFLAIALGSLEAGFEKLSPNLDAVARTLGETALSSLRRVHVPLLIPALGAAALLVFVDGMKELPATLLLRPFNFETLATHAYSYAALEQFERAALGALTIVLDRSCAGFCSCTRRWPAAGPALGLSRVAATRQGRAGDRLAPALCASMRELGEVAKELERLRIGKRFLVLDLASVHDLANGKLGDLARLGTGNVGHLHDPGRDVARAGSGADLALDALAQPCIERQAWFQDHEQHNPHIVLPVLTDDDALLHLFQLFDLAIDLRGADAHTAGIESCVRATVNNHATVLSPFGKVAMMPDIVEAREIGASIFLPSASFQNPSGMEGKGLVHTSSPLVVQLGGLAVCIEHVDGHAEPRTLDLPAPYRFGGNTQHEAAADIGATGDRGQMQSRA